MYIHSLLTLVNIDENISTPTMGVGANYSHLYLKDNNLHISLPYSTALEERIVAVRPSYIENHGIIYYDETGVRNEFNIISPNNTTTQLVLSSYDNEGTLTFEWVDIDDWIPDTYWSKNSYGLYPTISTDKVAIGKVPTDTDLPAGTTLYLHEGLRVNVGAVSVGTGSILTQAGNVFTLSGNIYTSNGYIRALDGDIYSTLGNIYATEGNIYTSNGSIGVRQGWIWLDENYTTVNTQLSNAISTQLIFGSSGSNFNSEPSYKLQSRSLENLMNDTGYGFKREKSTTISSGDTTWSIDHSLYEIEMVDYNKGGIIDVEISNPVVNKIYTVVIDSSAKSDGLSFESTVTIVSGSFIPATVNYMQIMCIDTAPTVQYLVTLSQEVGIANKATYSITDLSDVQNDYSTLPNRILRVNSTHDGIIFSSLLGATLSSSDGYIPSWNGTTGCLLNDGYAVATDLATDYTSAYLATADVIKEAIDTQKVQSVSASANVDADTKIILVDKSAGDVTLTFPDLSSSRARVWKVKDITTSDNNNKIIIATAGSQTIEGGTTLEIEGNNFARDVIFATNYYIA